MQLELKIEIIAYYSIVSYKLFDPVLTKTSQLNKTFTSEAIVLKTENNSYNCKWWEF